MVFRGGFLNKNMQKITPNSIPTHTVVSNGAENTQINIPNILTKDSESYTDFSDRLAELPAFCEHLPIEFKNAMIAMKDLHNTPYEFSLPCLLAMANTCSQHLYDVESHKYGIRPISLFIMGLLSSGGSKSTTMGLFSC
mgnify:CR=1 FL=1